MTVRKEGHEDNVQDIDWSGRRVVALEVALARSGSAEADGGSEAARDPATAKARSRAKAKARARRKARSRAKARRAPAADRDAQPGSQGYLSVHAIPWGKVYVDRRIYAPETPVLKGRVPAGRHSVKVWYPSLKRFSPPQTITIRAGEDKKLFFRD